MCSAFRDSIDQSNDLMHGKIGYIIKPYLITLFIDPQSICEGPKGNKNNSIRLQQSIWTHY